MIDAIFKYKPHISKTHPLFLASVPAGFPSPADDYLEKKLDLNEHLIQHPAATFFVKVSGESMINAGIFNEDILVVDRALEPANNDIVLAILDNEFTVKRLSMRGQQVLLIPENPDYKEIAVKPDQNFEIWGVVIHVIHSYRKR